ncbi:hypothetical protein DdX_01521 [Ditylenchus destructor]|uniref:Uncharacterized protein n=1 Tax=Ditylenchus destructor TaxID=166010 RepID=A0AAD4R857_9BILA|nr:hypothetical protein DdX_01521 [Ditylenchus destructor]
MNGIRPSKLPRKALIYDYTVQPIAETVIIRKFWSSHLVLSAPFLRPIVIDGVGLFKAYRSCCRPNLSECPFPMAQIVRCLFYWVCKGHSTILCFPSNCNPLLNEGFHATETDKTVIKELIKFKMAVFFKSDAEQNKEWYAKTVEKHQACLITTVSQWHMDMPNDLESFILSSENDYAGLDLRAYAKTERLLQPFFSDEHNLVFFSSFSASGECVSDLILKSTVSSQKDFNDMDDLQLNFVNQAKMLKALYTYLPRDSKLRETTVMLKVLKRLEDYL